MAKWPISVIIFAIISTLMALPCISYGQVPEPVNIPSELSEQERSALLRQRSDLLSQRNALEQEIKAQQNQCGRVNEKDTATVAFCRDWRAKLGEKYTNYINASNSFKQNIINRMEALIKDIKEHLERDKGAILKLGLRSRAEDFEDWEELTVDAQKHYEEQLQDSLVDLFFSGASDINKGFVKQIGSLNTFSARKLIGKLNKMGIQDEKIWNIIREVGATIGKPEKRKTTLELIEMLKKEGDLITISQTLSDGPSNIEKESEAFITILGWGLTGPLESLLASDVKFTISSLYRFGVYHVSVDNIQQLTNLTEKNLRSLKKLSEQMKNHVTKLKSARQTLNNLK